MLTRPHSSAFSALTRSPSIIISAARARPIRAGTNAVEPPSGTSPMFTKASRKKEEWAATIRSAESASEQPMPAAGPLTAETTGFGMSRIAWMIGW